MRYTRSSIAAALAATVPVALAQTSTSCNPTLKSDCAHDTGLNSKTFSSDFTNGGNTSWSAAAYTTINYGNNGAEFTINTSGQAPTIQTDFYIFFGRIDVKMKAAPGTGIVSSIVLESDDLDEIDWEFLGGNTGQVETNFFGKGNTTAYDRAIYYPVASPQTEFHTYTVDWNSDRLEFIIDGTTVRTLGYDDPLTLGGKNYPQTPMRLKLGNWAGGGPGEPQGTVQWAGGKCDFSDAPFTMYVESVNIQNYNPADKYIYGDETGSWQSIKIVQGNSESSPSGSGNSTGSASSTGGSSGGSSTSAPTSSVSVGNVAGQTVAAVTSTISGSSYSMNTASISAQNSGNGTLATSVVGATTEVPGSAPTGGSATAGAASGSATGSGAASATGTNAASFNTAMGSVSALGLILSFFVML